jgi:hypothetical protein
MNKLIKLIKKSNIGLKYYRVLNKHYVVLITKIFPVYATKRKYKMLFGTPINLANPQTFIEKCHWQKLYWRHPLVAKCADKYEVREYIQECGYAHVLNVLYGVYENTDEIEWDKLPSKFALKATHGCGFNIITSNKSNLNKVEVFKSLNGWLKQTYGLTTEEIQYFKMKPRIICERYLETDDGFFPNDYKFYCFNGTVHCVMAVSSRGQGTTKFDFYDRLWQKKLAYSKSSLKESRVIEKPKSYLQMIEVVEKISRPFPFVRVDFYDYNGVPIFGEMTFTPSGCNDTGYTKVGFENLSRVFKLPSKYKS